MGLIMFTRRLIHLNQQKFHILIHRFQDESFNDEIQEELMRADKVMNRKHSMQILNEIRSEINSGSEYESQSEVKKQHS